MPCTCGCGAVVDLFLGRGERRLSAPLQGAQVCPKREQREADCIGQQAALAVEEVAINPVDVAAAEGEWVELEPTAATMVQASQRAHVHLAGRYVTIVRVGKHLRAIDAICYHEGGALGLGDIEDVGEVGRSCLRCPKHRHLIDVETGVRWFQGMDKEWKPTDEPVQRVHEAKFGENGSVWVRLILDGERPTDRFANRPGRQPVGVGDLEAAMRHNLRSVKPTTMPE